MHMSRRDFGSVCSSPSRAKLQICVVVFCGRRRRNAPVAQKLTQFQVVPKREHPVAEGVLNSLLFLCDDAP
jgi:hypothetical protein